jgi:hypothetical protein
MCQACNGPKPETHRRLCKSCAGQAGWQRRKASDNRQPAKPLYCVCRVCSDRKPATDRPLCKSCAAQVRWHKREAEEDRQLAARPLVAPPPPTAEPPRATGQARPYRRPSETPAPRPSMREPDVDGLPEPERVFSPEERLAMTVFHQAVTDLSITHVQPRDKDGAALFLLGKEPYTAIHAFWCAVLNLDPRGAIEAVLLKHGTQIARVRSWAVREALTGRGKGRR